MNNNFEELTGRVHRLEVELETAVREVRKVRRSSAIRRVMWIGTTVVMAVLAASSRPIAQSSASRVRAPFEVVDAAGKPILVVRSEPRGLILQDVNSKITAMASVLADSSFFKVVSPAGTDEISLGAAQDGTIGLIARKVSQGKRTDRIRLVVPAATLMPTLELTNSKGQTIAALQQGQTGGALLQLQDAGGNGVVAAGVHPQTGVGLVQTFPHGNPGAGLVGMPGTFLMGRK